MKILLSGPFSPFSGYGNDLIGLARALMRWGADVYLQPNAVQPPLPQDVAMLLTKELEAPFDLFIQHVDPGALEITESERRSSTVAIGWSMWEWSDLSAHPDVKTFRERVEDFDAIVVYDQITRDGFAEHYDGPLPILQGGFQPEEWPEVERDWHEERFGFCMVGQLHARKGPFIAIQAFNELKHEYPEEFAPAELHLKTHVPGLHSAMEKSYDKLRVHYENWNKETLYNFYAAQHCLLAPSKGEGKNMPALEFQSTGGVVIATNWAGMATWLDPSFSYPLDYKLVAEDQKFPTSYCAAADVEDLKRLMLHVFRNRNEAKEKGKLASAMITATKNWDKVVEDLFLRLKNNLPPAAGSLLWSQAQQCRKDTSYGSRRD